jgi:hypothetical protein
VPTSESGLVVNPCVCVPVVLVFAAPSCLRGLNLASRLQLPVLSHVIAALTLTTRGLEPLIYAHNLICKDGEALAFERAVLQCRNASRHGAAQRCTGPFGFA